MSVYEQHRMFEAPVDKRRCRESVANGGRSVSFHQCSRKATITENGMGWCKQHAPATEAKKRADEQAHWEAKMRSADHTEAIARAERAVVDTAMALYAKLEFCGPQSAGVLAEKNQKACAVLAKLRARDKE